MIVEICKKGDGEMIVNAGFQEMPPKMFLMQIMDEISKVYCFLWEKKDKKNIVKFTWKEIVKYYNKNHFRTSLRKLTNQGLLNYDEAKEGVKIELVSWEDMSEE